MDKVIREIRKQINAVEISLQPKVDSRELSLVYTNLQRGIMFLGLVLKEMGEPNPYPESSNPDSHKIEKRADTAEQPLDVPDGRTAGVKYLRSVIQTIINQLQDREFSNRDVGGEAAIRFYLLSVEALTESKLWLGMELNSIRLKDEQTEIVKLRYQTALENEALNAYARYKSRSDVNKTMPEFLGLNELSQKAWIESVMPYVQTPEQVEAARMRFTGMGAKPDPWEKPEPKNKTIDAGNGRMEIIK
jgi:hypothetical protein